MVIRRSCRVGRFWRGLYCRYDSGIQPRESLLDTVCALKEHTTSLEDHTKLVEKVDLLLLYLLCWLRHLLDGSKVLVHFAKRHIRAHFDNAAAA